MATVPRRSREITKGEVKHRTRRVQMLIPPHTLHSNRHWPCRLHLQNEQVLLNIDHRHEILRRHFHDIQ